MNPPPVFIVGPPRSGTSLLRQMLNRHPALASLFFPLLYQDRQRKAFGDLSNPANRERLVSEYVSLPTTKGLGLDCAKLADRLRREATSYQALYAAVLNFYAESHGKPRSGEKTPRHALYLDTLREWFPDAPILHIVRDPRDVVTSSHRMFGAPSAVVTARTWLSHNLAARRSSHRSQYLEVRYETLVAQPELELTRICKFIGEEYFPSMLTPEQRSVEHPGEWDRLQTPLTTGRVGQWRRELTRQQVAQIEWVLGPHLETFGYAREAPAASASAILGGASFAALVSARRTIRRLPATWYNLLKPAEIAKYEYWTYRKTWAAIQPAGGIRAR